VSLKPPINLVMRIRDTRCHNYQEAEALLLGADSPGRVQSTVSMGPPGQGSNRVDHSMGSGDRPV
jgi:hypothetical protein